MSLSFIPVSPFFSLSCIICTLSISATGSYSRTIPSHPSHPTIRSPCRLCYFTVTLVTPSCRFSFFLNLSCLPSVTMPSSPYFALAPYLHTPMGFGLVYIVSRIIISHLCILQHSAILFLAPNLASTVRLPYYLSYLLVSSTCLCMTDALFACRWET